MPQADLDVIRRWFDAWNHADLDAFAATFVDDAELVTDPSWMEAGPFRGRAAVTDWYEGLRESWGERNAVVLTELFEAGEQVVARVDWQVRGRTSGIDAALDATCVSTVRQGRIVRQQWYFDHASALAAVGLPQLPRNLGDSA
jgi:ketosteroid isomerase-like protein